MSEQIAQQNVKFILFKKLLFNFKVSKGIKDCNNIESYLQRKHILNNSDSRLKLIISNGFINEVEDSYFLYKGYTSNGSLTPLKKYSIIDRKIEEFVDTINHDIIIIDLYEKSIYLHSYVKTEDFITGYLINEEIISEKSENLIFSNEKVKINVKNINKFDTATVVDDFINKYII